MYVYYCVQVIRIQSPFPCFAGKDSSAVVESLSRRFRTELSDKEVRDSDILHGYIARILLN